MIQPSAVSVWKFWAIIVESPYACEFAGIVAGKELPARMITPELGKQHRICYTPGCHGRRNPPRELSTSLH